MSPTPAPRSPWWLFFFLAIPPLGVYVGCHHLAPRRVEAASLAPPARAFQARSAEDLVRGTYAAGHPGDMVLENRYVRAVIDDVGPGSGNGSAMTGGQLLDLVRRGGEDEFGQLFNFLGEFPRQLAYRTLRTDVRRDGSAAVIAQGDDPRTPGLSGTTVYSLGRDDRAITLTTKLTYHGAQPTELGLGDVIFWAGVERWAPGRGFVFHGNTEEPYMLGVGSKATYAYVAPGGLSGTQGFTRSVRYPESHGRSAKVVQDNSHSRECHARACFHRTNVNPLCCRSDSRGSQCTGSITPPAATPIRRVYVTDSPEASVTRR